eukprot:863740-Pelagomonas_calceolata.AAC.1
MAEAKIIGLNTGFYSTHTHMCARTCAHHLTSTKATVSLPTGGLTQGGAHLLAFGFMPIAHPSCAELVPVGVLLAGVSREMHSTTGKGRV